MVDITAEPYAAYRDVLLDDTYPTLAGLRNMLEIQADIDTRAAKTKVEDFVDLRFVDEVKKNGFLAQLL